MKKTLVIYTAATEGYQYALGMQAHKVVANLHAESRSAGMNIHMVLISNQESCLTEAEGIYRAAGIETHTVVDSRFACGTENYQKDAQLLIAQMRTAGCGLARSLNADFVWSLDSDILPPHNALRCMLDMLAFDSGYYGAAFCPYPSQGGGLFLGGRGVTHDPIFPNSYPEEKELPAEMEERKKELEGLLDQNKEEGPQAAAMLAELREIHRAMRDFPAGENVFARNAKKWRQRGWFDEAYPAIGKGAIVPVDWTGSGCLLMGREALSLCDWFGYDGGGTEDLYINYHRWAAAGLKVCAIPHCPCDHIVRHRTIKGKLVHVRSYHEERGECVGHLRQRALPFHAHIPGERHCAENDGSLGNGEPKPDQK